MVEQVAKRAWMPPQATIEIKYLAQSSRLGFVVSGPLTDSLQTEVQGFGAW